MIRWILSLLLITVLGAAAVAWDARERLRSPLPVTETTLLQFETGSSLSGLINRLHRDGLLGHPRTGFYLRVYARVTDSARNLHAGEYALQPGLTPIALLELLASGAVVEYSFTIIEGWTTRELLVALRAEEALSWNLGEALPETEHLLTELGVGDGHAEGRFLPETYRYARGTTVSSLLLRAYHAMERALEQAWAQRAPDLPLKSAYEALTLASIVEKETGVASERGTIAGVFTRRLRKNMRLQTDPTVIYGIGPSFDGDIRYRDLRTDTPYNTYTRGGLPPTPICNPGVAALIAAVQPEAGTALYFVSRGDGSHVFSDTLEAHNAAVRRYQLRRR